MLRFFEGFACTASVDRDFEQVLTKGEVVFVSFGFEHINLQCSLYNGRGRFAQVLLIPNPVGLFHFSGSLSEIA